MRREADTASARVKRAKKRRGRERAGFADANFNVKFRLKPGFDLDKFELAAGGSDSRRGYFINGPGESRVLDFARQTALRVAARANLRGVRRVNLGAKRRINLSKMSASDISRQSPC